LFTKRGWGCTGLSVGLYLAFLRAFGVKESGKKNTKTKRKPRKSAIVVLPILKGKKKTRGTAHTKKGKTKNPTK